VLGFGEIDLPSVTDALPAPFSNDKQLPARPTPGPSPLDSFGEIELPHEPPPGMASHVPAGPSHPPGSSGDFGELQLEEGPRAPAARGHSAVARADSVGAVGSASYGEVSFGGGEGGAAGEPIGIDSAHMPPAVSAPPPPEGGASLGEAHSLPPPSAAATAGVAAAAAHVPLRGRPVEPPHRRSARGLVVAGFLAVVVVAGAALQLTPYGAFGYQYVGDRLHAADYERATQMATLEAERALSPDTYDAAKSAADGALAAHARATRAQSLTAYAAFVDLATTVRFGPDTARGPRAKQLLGELPAKGDPAKYQDIAQAAQLAADGDASGAA
jgi:hypothetical protein